MSWLPSANRESRIRRSSERSSSSSNPPFREKNFPGGVQYCTVEAASQDSMPQMMTASTSSSWRSMAL